jgi:hypothetical protein
LDKKIKIAFLNKFGLSTRKSNNCLKIKSFSKTGWAVDQELKNIIAFQNQFGQLTRKLKIQLLFKIRLGTVGQEIKN